MFASNSAISAFLSRLAESYRSGGTLYLIGESSLVVEGKRAFCSEIIVAGDVPDGDMDHFGRAIDSAASAVGIVVTIEHPEDVIPLPEGAHDRSRNVTGFPDRSPLIFRHFDPYTTAIRFIARGDEPDYDLVVALLEMGWIEMRDLESEIRALLPRFSFETIQQDPAEFRRKFKGLFQMWRSRSAVRSDTRGSGSVKV